VVPPLTVIHAVELKEPQVQPEPAVTVTVSVPVDPAAGADTLVGVTLYVHAAAACEMVVVSPPIVIVPERDAPVFAATL
jgi:hypothetical protein